MTSWPLIAAAVLTTGVGITHSWLGEVKLIAPLLAPGRRPPILDKSAFARSVLRFAWHVTSVAWWGFAAVFVALAQAPANDTSRLVLAITAATFALTGAIVLVSSGGRHLAWPLFLGIAALSLPPLL